MHSTISACIARVGLTRAPHHCFHHLFIAHLGHASHACGQRREGSGSTVVIFGAAGAPARVQAARAGRRWACKHIKAAAASSVSALEQGEDSQAAQGRKARGVEQTGRPAGGAQQRAVGSCQPTLRAAAEGHHAAERLHLRAHAGEHANQLRHLRCQWRLSKCTSGKARKWSKARGGRVVSMPIAPPPAVSTGLVGWDGTQTGAWTEQAINSSRLSMCCRLASSQPAAAEGWGRGRLLPARCPT